MQHRFNPPPGWAVPPGFTPDSDWRPDPGWPPAPEGWQFWIPEPEPAPGPVASAGGQADPSGAPAPGPEPVTQRAGGLLRSWKSRAQSEDWVGKAKAAATQVGASAQQATGQATAMAKQRDQAALDKAGPLPEGALWRGVSHESGRNAIVTLFPDRIERVKASSRMSLTGMLAGGPEDVEVIPTKSISSVQSRRGPWYHDVTIYASGNTIVLSVDAADAQALRTLIMEQVAGGAARPPVPAATAQEPMPPAGDALIEQIRKLGELRDAGFITPEEYEAKKIELLGRL